MSRTLAEWLTYLETLHPKSVELGLDRVDKVRKQLQLDPKFPVIVVGGTNGKGSVCAMLESMLHAAGYRVGCYTSPHLLRYNERVRIQKQEVCDAELCASFELIEKSRDNVALTYFEFGTLAAMQCFISHDVEVAILEVGLGGRLDAVNVFASDCAVVTSVDIDHTDYLGDTREKIAFEKAGIFRAGKIAVFGDTSIPDTIISEAEKIGAELWCLGAQYNFEFNELQWEYQGGTRRGSLPFPALRGAYQLNNASSALVVLDAMRDSLPVSMAAVRRGLTEVELAGRFQVLPGKPVIVLDVAHNPHAANALAKNLANMPPSPKTYAVCAMLKDKDMAGVVREMRWQVDIWLVAGIAAPRGATADELAQVVMQELIDGEVLTFTSVENAIHHARNGANENDRIIAFGSFYTVAEAIRAISAQ